MPNKQISPEISSLFSLVKKPKFLSAVSDQILYTDDILSEPTPLLCPKTVFKHMERVCIGESSVERYTYLICMWKVCVWLVWLNIILLTLPRARGSNAATLMTDSILLHVDE